MEESPCTAWSSIHRSLDLRYSLEMEPTVRFFSVHAISIFLLGSFQLACEGLLRVEPSLFSDAERVLLDGSLEGDLPGACDGPACFEKDQGLLEPDLCEGIDCGLGHCQQEGEHALCLCLAGAELREGRCEISEDLCLNHLCGLGSCHLREGEPYCECAPEAEQISGICVDPEEICRGIECGSGGECSVVEGLPECRCDEHALSLGDLCVDPCERFNCGLGLCRAQEGEARCDCQEGAILQGGRCIDPCTFIDCGYGHCVEGPHCVCEEGAFLEGDLCVNPCAEISCDTGICRIEGGLPFCDCGPGQLFQEGRCFDPCLGVECGRGECRLEEAQSYCHCEPGYISNGGPCLDPCQGVQCGLNAHCIYRMAPECECDPGFSGPGCLPDDPCDGVDCDGQGRCVSDRGQARCDCEAGYHAQGLHCVADEGPCDGQECSGRGECLEKPSSGGTIPICACEPGFTPSNAAGLDCVATANVCTGGEINYDVDGDGQPEARFEPSADECRMYELVNWTRATHDAEGEPECHTPLAYDLIWSAHARNHSIQMGSGRGLFHEDHPGGQNCNSPGSPESNMQSYMTGRDEGHCPPLSHHCNIMRCRFRAIGIGYYNGWNTQNFH